MQPHVLETADPRVLGQRLQEARKARGLTQQEAADFLKVARTTITALEKGDRRLRPDELIQLAKLYARPVSRFVGAKESIVDFTVQFRTAMAHSGPRQARKELQEAVQEFQELCENYLYLEKLNGIRWRPSYPPQYPIAGISPEDAAEDTALSERNRLGLGDGPVLNLREVLENDIGVRVFYTQLPARLAGIFAYTEELGGCIAVNARHPEERRRWSMAHEYGRFLTNRFRAELTLDVYKRIPAAERFADAFARSMLMPAAGLRRRFYQISREAEGRITAADLCRIAHYYFVSVHAVMLRLEELRLLPRGTWERLCDRGFKVREAQEESSLALRSHDDRLLPLRYQFLAVRSYEDGNLTEGELTRLLYVDRVSARRTVQKLTYPLHLLDKGPVVSLR